MCKTTPIYRHTPIVVLSPILRTFFRFPVCAYVQVLMGSSLWGVLASLDLCRTIVNRIRLNYFWALL